MIDGAAVGALLEEAQLLLAGAELEDRLHAHADLGAIFDASEVQRAPLLGISQGAAVAAAYAARNPERVSALILIGGCARGWRVKRSAALHESFEALMALMRQGWEGLCDDEDC